MTERIPESKKTLKELRARYGLSQTEAAEKLGISPPSYNKWEKNIGDVVISDHTCTDHYIYSFEGRRWRKQPELILSDREKEILQLSVKGLSNTEIGETLFIDANTVKFHKKKIFEKLHAENITEAVGIAANLRLI